MTNKKKENGNLIKKLLWWIPIIILGLMFALGACTRQETRREDNRVESSKESISRAESSQIEESPDEKTNAQSSEESPPESSSLSVEENGNYTSKEEVALYIHTFGKLPINYITKKQAQELGWDPSSGNLSDILPGMSIGGSAFGNYEGALPRASTRRYFECDIDYEGGYRGAKRLIYSNDGLVFYTEDHYKTFEQIY
jgi:ribonuclease